MALDQELEPLPLPPLHRRLDVPAPQAALPWPVRWLDALRQLTPLLIMGALALVTTWLLRQTDRSDAMPTAAAVRHVPDYEMRGFSIQRHVVPGLSPSVVEGDRVRHYPDTDTLEIDGVRVRWMELSGQVTVISAARAVLYEERSEVILDGGAKLTRPPLQAGQAPMEFTGEQLIVDTEHQIVRSERPVLLRQGDDVFEGARLRYDHRASDLSLSGAVRGRVRP